jgi:SAM-dependent methyltransferase/uncharacterized protein YbaR (Trm112 family)
MWCRFARSLCCPLCGNALHLSSIAERRVTVADDHIALARGRKLLDDSFDMYVDTGLLLCHTCRTWFPIVSSVPVLLSHATPVHEVFARDFAGRISLVAAGYTPPRKPAVPGEIAVMKSFSVQWCDYAFDGVMWEMDYEEHERRVLSELEGSLGSQADGMFLELGCGLGLTCHLIQKNYGIDAVGVDLSAAAIRAARNYETNPFLHFVQASVFDLPFRPGSFHHVYSRGVLHHTFSTREAFRALARYCGFGGTLYIWVYGSASITANPVRRGLYAVERLLRPILSELPSSMSTAVLSPIAIGYMAFNRYRRRRSRRVQPYTFGRALHAARDRFTPKYAHRQSHQEVVRWFRDAGFEDVEVVDWRRMPATDQADYRRNIGVRGTRRREDEEGRVA